MKRFFLKNSKLKLVFIIFAVFELLNFSVLLISNFLSPIIKLFRFDNNSWGILRSYGNFDGFHYYHIAKEGYGLYQEAFFPLYPLLIRISSFFTNTHFINGLIISNLSFLFFLYFFYIFLTELIGKEKTLWTIVFLLSFPTSFFFVMYYSESLFLLMFILYLYFLKKEKYGLSSIFGFLTALTRLIGVFAIVPVFVYLFLERKKLDFKKILVLLSPVLGFLTYSIFLQKTTGDFLKFLHVQPQFGANRSAEIILLPQVVFRYFKILATAAFDFTYYIAFFELVVFATVFSVLIFQLFALSKKRYSFLKRESFAFILGINLFSLVNITLPTLSGTFSSIPRYALLSLGFFIALSFIDRKIIKYIIVGIFVIFHIIFLNLFFRNYFVG